MSVQKIEDRYPYSPDEERIIVATCCSRDSADVIPLLPVNVLDMFYRQDLRELMSVVLELDKSGIKPDFVNVFSFLEKDSTRLKKCGGIDNVTYVIDRVWSISANFEFHLNKFIDLYKRREFILECEASISKARDLLADDYSQYLLNKIDLINRAAIDNKIPNLADKVLDFIFAISEGKAEKRIPLNIPVIDSYIKGVTIDTLNIIGGRTGMGKTAVALAIAKGMYKAGNKVLYFNLEMSDNQILGRILASEVNIPYKYFSSGLVTEKSYEALSDAYVKLFPDNIRNNFVLESQAGLTVEDICRKATIQKFKNGLDVIFVDYLGRLFVPDIAKNSHIALGEVARKLKSLAMKLNVAVFLLVQGNKVNEIAQDKRMSIASIAGSDMVACEADNIFLLYRDAYYQNDTPNKDLLEINHVKARNNEPRKYNTFFSFSKMCFYDGPMGGELQPKEKSKEAKEYFNYK